MKKSGRLICGSLSLALCVSGSGCAGQGVKNLFVWDKTADYRTLEEMERSPEVSGSKSVASAETSNSADDEGTTWRGRLASWTPFGAKDAESAATADPFLNDQDSTDQIASVSQSRTVDESAATRKSIDDAMQKSTAETEHLFADLKTKKTPVAETKPNKTVSPRKAIEELDALLASEARSRSEEEAVSENSPMAMGVDELLASDDDAAEAVAIFDSKTAVQTSRDRRTSGNRPRSSAELFAGVAAKSNASAFDELVSGVNALADDIGEGQSIAEELADDEVAESKTAQNNRLAKAEEDFFNTLQTARKVSETARRDPFEAAAAVAQRISDDSDFEWTKPVEETADLELASHRTGVQENRNVFANAAFQSVRPASDSHRALEFPVTTVSSGSVISDPVSAASLVDPSDPFFSAGAAPATITEIPVETVAAANSQNSAPGLWKSISLRNVILVVGAIIVAFLLFAPNRKETT